MSGLLHLLDIHVGISYGERGSVVPLRAPNKLFNLWQGKCKGRYKPDSLNQVSDCRVVELILLYHTLLASDKQQLEHN